MGLEKYFIPVYLFGTTEEIDHYDLLYRIEHDHRGFDGAPFGLASFTQFVSLATALIAGKETGSNIYSAAGFYLATDLSWRFLKSLVYGTDLGEQSGLIGTVRGLYKKIKNHKNLVNNK
jgi:hypothetical protein